MRVRKLNPSVLQMNINHYARRILLYMFLTLTVTICVLPQTLSIQWYLLVRRLSGSGIVATRNT